MGFKEMSLELSIRSLADAGRYEEALAAYQRIIDQSPKSAKAIETSLSMAGIYLYELRKTDKAKEILEDIVRLYPDSDWSLMAEAMLLDLGEEPSSSKKSMPPVELSQKTTGAENQHFSVASYPNPFNSETQISYYLPCEAEVRIVICNILGEVVKTLVDERKQAGTHSVHWRGEDTFGSDVSSGVYFCQITAGGFKKVTKMILLR